MTQAGSRPDKSIALAVAATLAAATLSCRSGASAAKAPPTTVLRIGLSLGNVALRNPNQGIRQIGSNITTEGLARPADDGRMGRTTPGRVSCRVAGPGRRRSEGTTPA